MPHQTNVTTEALRGLHGIHRQLTDLNARLRRGPNLVRAHEANVQRQQDELARLQEETKTARIASDAKQGQLRDGEERVKKLQEQLLTASSNREYQALKEQIAAIEMTNSILEDEILEGLDKLDQLAEKITHAEAVLIKVRTEAQKNAQEVQQEEPLIQGDIERLEAELKASENELPADFRAIYDRLVHARGEDALTSVEGEYCSGCHQHVPLNMVNDLMLAKPILCKSCGRLLYLPENWLP
jgi:predicted  nucleic acid-binding Zn-ribbon protein